MLVHEHPINGVEDQVSEIGPTPPWASAPGNLATLKLKLFKERKHDQKVRVGNH